jgi:pimeloyl-ACP methyl ester carboxylesterase
MHAFSRRSLLAGLALGVAASHAYAGAAPVEIVLHAIDGVSVYGWSLPARGASRGMILLFHMADASAAEYAPIQPRLAALGFDSLAIDQRSGGSYFGGTNRTAAQFTDDPGYGAALADMEAALAQGLDESAESAIVWGSGYSAALVFVLAARHPGMVRAVLAFSPGESIEGISIRDAASEVQCPVFVTAAPGEVNDAVPIFRAVPAERKVFYRQRIGVHGASTLRTDRDPRGAAANWRAVAAFLKSL